MTPEEILQTLKAAANFEMKREDFGWCGHGAINNFPECRVLGGMTPNEYARHYDRNSSLLESLPWTKEVKCPRNPLPDEYPDKDGEYITMLDCDEHAIWCNKFKDGHWVIYDRTHVKWWMPIPEIQKSSDMKSEDI